MTPRSSERFTREIAECLSQSVMGSSRLADCSALYDAAFVKRSLRRAQAVTKALTSALGISISG